MQDLDTFGVLRRFAENPDSNADRLAFIMLRRRTVLHAGWDSLQHNAELTMEGIYGGCFGIGAGQLGGAATENNGGMQLGKMLQELYSLSPELYNKAYMLLISDGGE